MSSGVDKPSSVGAAVQDAVAPGAVRRRNDAQASRTALLDAAGALFDERGYQAATVRDIGERAGVDPSLIARYFGGKEGLYLAVLEQVERPPGPTDPHAIVAKFLAKSEDDGSNNPISLAMVSPAMSEGLREQVRELLGRRVVGPLAEELAARGVDRAALRAELVVAVAVGVTLTRVGGTLPELADVSLSELQAVLAPLVAELVGEAR
jgi:AcrR family transcriptional regulator